MPLLFILGAGAYSVYWLSQQTSADTSYHAVYSLQAFSVEWWLLTALVLLGTCMASVETFIKIRSLVTK